MFNLNRQYILASAILTGAMATSSRANVLTTESFALPSGPGNSASAPYQDEVVDTSPLTTWGEKGAEGVQGNQSIYPSGSGYVNNPASVVTFKFNVGSTVASLNATYGAGNWTIASPTLTFQYTLYANNPVFGAGAGDFDTYWVANDSWAFGQGAPSGNAYADNDYVTGTDPAFALSAAALLPWAGSEADLGSTTYNWLSPGNNPNYSSWSTDKSGKNQGMITDSLTVDSAFVTDILSATASTDPNVSLYLMPTSNTLGLTIFTGGGNVTPELNFQVVSVPEPMAATALLVLLPVLGIRWRK